MLRDVAQHNLNSVLFNTDDIYMPFPLNGLAQKKLADGLGHNRTHGLCVLITTNGKIVPACTTISKSLHNVERVMYTVRASDWGGIMSQAPLR